MDLKGISQHFILSLKCPLLIIGTFLSILPPPTSCYFTQAFKEAENWVRRYYSRSSSSVGGFVFREPEGTKVFETYCLAAAQTDTDEVNMDTQKVSGDKDTSGA